MSLVVGIDVGGTKTLGATCEVGPDGLLQVRNHVTVRNADFPSFAALAADVMASLGVSEGSGMPIGVAAAGVREGTSRIIHPDYPGGALDANDFGRFGLLRAVLNDFEAQAWSLCTATVRHSGHVLGPNEHRSGGIRVIIGPGTGLGVAALDAKSGVRRERVIRSEGGHGAIPFQFPEQLGILRFMVDQPEAVRHSAAMCAEALLSGEGLSLVHRYHSGAYVDPMQVGSVIYPQGLRLFALFLGLFCRDRVVTFTGFEGLYLTGGVLRRTQMLQQTEVLAAFQRGFHSSVRHMEALQQTPVWLLGDESGGALGAAYAALLASN